MNDKLKQYLEEVKARAAVATPGPWFTRKLDKDCNAEVLTKAANVYTGVCHINSAKQSVDAVFIAHARTDVPRLAAALEKAIEQRNSYAKVHELTEPGDVEKDDAEIASILASGTSETSIEALLRGAKLLKGEK